MSVRKIRNSWWVDFRHTGERHRKRSPLNSRHGAEDYELTLRSRLNRGEPIDGPDVEQPRVPTFAEFAVEWFETYVKANNKPSEVSMKRSILTCHLLPAFGGSPLDSVTTRAIERYKKDKLQAQLSPKTINNQLTVLHKLLATAVEWERLSWAPIVRWLRYTRPPIRFLSRDEVARLLAAPTDPEIAMMLRLALATGMRLGEILGLQWSSIDLASSRVIVERSLVNGVLGTPKNSRVRTIPLMPALRAGLDRFRRREDRGDSGYVFTKPDGSPLTAYLAIWRLHRVCDGAGLPFAGWHALRHTFATTLAAKGAPLRAVQELLGHSTIAMTERYTHVSGDQLRDAVALLVEPMPGHATQKVGQPAVNNGITVA